MTAPNTPTPELERYQTIMVKLRIRDKNATELNRQARAVNFVWNYLNETSRMAWQRDRKWLSKYDLQKLTSGSSIELGLHANTITRICNVYAANRDKAKRAGIRWRSVKSLGWVPFNTTHVTFDGALLKFRSVKYQTMHHHPLLVKGMKIRAGAFHQDSKGCWYISLPIDVKCAEHRADNPIGIDFGLKDLATLSDGRKILAPQFYRKSEVAIATVQRAGKTKRVRSIHAKAANRRKDFLHKASAVIAQNHGFIVIGDVSSTKLTQTWMAKSVLDAGWSDLKFMISYKANMHGGKSIVVNENLSTQTCSECGGLPISRPKGIAGLRIRDWTCDDCGSVHDRDVNAARNILRIGLDTLVEGALL